MMLQLLRRLFRRLFAQPPPAWRVLVAVVAIVAYGATGFLYFELQNNPDLTPADALWYAFVTMTTVGYGDYYPTTFGGRFIVAWPLMLFGIGLLGYVLSVAASWLVESRTKEIKGMVHHRLLDHLVLINFPGASKVERVLDELASDTLFGDRKVVLIDEELSELPPALVERDIRYVRGNPTRDETLTRASLDQADFAIVLSRDQTSQSDSTNVAIALAIEGRSKQVYSVVECVDPATEELLRKAGCDRIVCTSRFEAHFLSHELLNPGVQEVLSELTSNLHGQQLYVTHYEGSDELTQAELIDSCRQNGHLFVGIRKKEKTFLNPASEFQLEAGDALISIGAERLKLKVS